MAAGGLIVDPDLISYTLKKLNTSCVWAAGTVTVVTTLPHGFITNDFVHVGGVDNQKIEGNYTVTVVNATTFTFPLADPGFQSSTPGYCFSATAELLVDQVRKSIKLNRVGNLTADGVTIKCIYSKLKEIWITDATLIKFPFPMTPITDEQFEFKDGWVVEKRYSSLTEVHIAGVSGVSGQSTITTTGGAFLHPSLVTETYIGYNLPGLPVNNGGTSGQEGAKIVSVSPDGNTITMDKPNIGDFSGSTVSFWTKNDHTHWLIRTGGWAIKGTDGNTQEEWANFTTLGNLGAQGSTVSLANFSTTSASTTATCTSTAGVVAGSYITAPNILDGTKVASITNGTTLELSYPASKTASGGVATIRPKDQVYYQLGSATTAGKIFALTGAVNQALRYKQYQTTFTADTSIATIAITGMSWSGGTQKVSFTATGHTFVVGDSINIAGSLTSGATPTCLNGVKVISDVAGDVISFVVAYDPGTVTTQGTVSDSPMLRSVSSTAGLYVGLNISGTGIATGSSITAINGTKVSLTHAATATGTGVTISTGSYSGDAGNVANVFTREQSYTYGKSSKAQIGESVLAYKKYAFPLSNTADLKITHTDTQVDADAPYTTMNITWYGTPQQRTIGGVPRDFNVIIDADTGLASGASGTATSAQIYEFVQRSLRKTSDIDAGAGTKNGNITRELLKFVGDTLYTLYDTDGGVYIDNFNTADINNIVFADNTGTNRTYPYTAAGTLLPNTYLVTDGAGSNAIYRAFFKQLQGGKKYGTVDALLVNKADNSTPVSGFVTGSTIPFDFDYDGNTQATWTAATTYAVGDEYRNDTTWYRVTTGYTSGGTFGATDTTNSQTISGPSIVVTALGKSTAQAVVTEGTIARSTSNSFSLVAALERNYQNLA